MERVERAPGALGRTAGLAVDAGAPSRVRPMVIAPLLLRWGLGAIFFVHGAQKLFGAFGGAGLGGTANGFEAMGLKPALFLAIVAALLEFGGSLLLAVGLLTRPIAALLAFEMLFALFAVHAPNGFLLNWACAAGKGHGIEYNLILVSSLTALALLGPGKASLDGSRAVRQKLRIPTVPTPRPRP
ncbi:MAG TPA: DoxX family protein [Myxococcales bacterium]|jgi:putative oxidoreductase